MISLLALAIAAAPAPAARPVPIADTATGWRFGSASAPRQLVEYGSLNCGHCAHFASFASAPMLAEIRAGRLAFEYRPFLIFPHDVPATLIARCVPAGRRYAYIDAYYKASPAITARLVAAQGGPALTAAREQGMAAVSRVMADLGGMKPLAARFGLTPERVDACVADQAGLDWLQSSYQAGKADGVNSTPTFRFNGKPVKIDTPAELRALLKTR